MHNLFYSTLFFSIVNRKNLMFFLLFPLVFVRVGISRKKDNDETLECAVLTIYEAAGRQYIALLPLDENGEESEESDVYIYRFSETEDGEPNLENIEDDDEYDAAADKFDEWMDSLEFDEIDLDAE
mgnify:CR=1 FL=1